MYWFSISEPHTYASKEKLYIYERHVEKEATHTPITFSVCIIEDFPNNIYKKNISQMKIPILNDYVIFVSDIFYYPLFYMIYGLNNE